MSFNIERKSLRNQAIVEAQRGDNRSARKARRALNRHSPRFAPGVELPPIPEGMILAKSCGEPVVIPAAVAGEPRYGNSPFTIRQLETLSRLARPPFRRSLGVGGW